MGGATLGLFHLERVMEMQVSILWCMYVYIVVHVLPGSSLITLYIRKTSG